MDQAEILVKNLDEDYHKLTRDPRKYFYSIGDLRGKKVLLDTNIFYPISASTILYLISENNGLENHIFYSLSNSQMVKGVQTYKESLYRMLEKKPNIFLTDSIFSEITAETGFWRGILEKLSNYNINLRDVKKRVLFEKLIKFGEFYLEYLCNRHDSARDLIKKKTLRTKGIHSRLEDSLTRFMNESHVNCSDCDKDLVFNSFRYGFKENLTLVSGDIHILRLVEHLGKNKKSLEEMADKRVSLLVKKFWHGFITYVFDFVHRDQN